jgi:hypothetical protein
MDTVYAIVLNSDKADLFESILKHASEIALLIGSIIASVAACFGIKAWRVQLHGSYEFDLAKVFYKELLVVKEEIERFRNPWKDISEILEVLRENNLPNQSLQDIMRQEIDKYLYPKRWNRLFKVWNAFQEKVLEAEVLWGEQVKKNIEELNKSIRKLYSSMDSYLRRQSSGLSLNDPFYEELRRIIEKTDILEQPDLFGRALESKFLSLEQFMASKIRK